MPKYTFAVKSVNRPYSMPFVKEFDCDELAIKWARAEIADSGNMVSFILIRRGDAGPEVEVFWDSRNYKTDMNSHTMRVFMVQTMAAQHERELAEFIRKTRSPEEYKRFCIENGYEAPKPEVVESTPEEKRDLTARMLLLYGASHESVLTQLRKIEPRLNDVQLQEVINKTEIAFESSLFLGKRRPVWAV